MLHQVNSSKPLDEIDRGLREAAAREQFGVIAVHDLKETLKNKGQNLDMDCLVYEVCNPKQAKTVLESDGAISTALPCRISVYGSANHYTLATMRPTEMMKAFSGGGDVQRVAGEVETVLFRIINEAAGNTGFSL